MADAQLVKYIKDNLAIGYKPEQITDFLLKNGYSSSDVKDAMNQAVPGHGGSNKINGTPLLIGAGAMIFIIFIVFLVFLIIGSGEEVEPVDLCPEGCDDNDPCTDDYCSDGCVNERITSCYSGDSCCPAGCVYSSDSDCPVSDECNSAADCDDNDACTLDVCDGSPKKCKSTAIRDCSNADGCCPSGCTYETDDDCSLDDQCNFDSDCDDGESCTLDLCMGSPKACNNSRILSCSDDDMCCPLGCVYDTDNDCNMTDICILAADCDDDDACTIDQCKGEPKNCTYTAITSCLTADGCCPIGCTFAEDNDCPPDLCINSTDCDDADPSTTDICDGSPKKCRYVNITGCIDADGYCPEICTFDLDDDCDECDIDEDCDDTILSTSDICNGTPKRCHNDEITDCIDDDNYCPETCSADDDNDCGKCIYNSDCKANCSIGRCEGGFCEFDPVTECTDDGCCPDTCSFVNDQDCPEFEHPCDGMTLTKYHRCFNEFAIYQSNISLCTYGSLLANTCPILLHGDSCDSVPMVEEEENICYYKKAIIEDDEAICDNMVGSYADDYKAACTATLNSDILTLPSGWEDWYYFERGLADTNSSMCPLISVGNAYGLRDICNLLISS